MPLTNTEMGKSNHLDQTLFSPDHFSQVFQQNFYLNIIKNMKLGKRDFKQSLQTQAIIIIVIFIHFLSMNSIRTGVTTSYC